VPGIAHATAKRSGGRATYAVGIGNALHFLGFHNRSPPRRAHPRSPDSADSRVAENSSPTIDIVQDGNLSGPCVLDVRARDDSYCFLEGAVVTKRFKNSRKTNGLEVERTKEDYALVRSPSIGR
jgi:hypothetical protein